jgi:pilus assembly protein FimV
VPGGIDIGAETVVVAAPDETTRHRNAIRVIEDRAAVEDSSLTFQHDGTHYAIGTAAEHAGDGDGDHAVERLFGGQQDGDLVGRALEALLAAAAGRPRGTYGCVDRDAAVLNAISDPTADREFELMPVDPGMAVCYEAFDPPPGGLGVVLGDGRAVGTLAVEGVPVATATVTYEDQWYDVTDAVEDVSTDSVRAAWNRGQYGAVLGVLATELAGRAPSVAGPLAVALGGSDAPRGLTAADLHLAGEALDVTVDAVTVADRPAETPARGALAAARVGERSGPVPAFAATDEYARGRVDIEGTTAALAGVVEDADAPESADVDGTAGGGGTTAREGSRDESGVGPALAALAEQLDAETGRLDRLFDEVDETVASVEADLADLERESPSGERVGELEATVDRTEETLGEVTDDIAEIQAVLAGLDDESFDGADASGAYESVAVDALQDDIESVESALSGRIETIWDEIDGIEDQLVDVSAQLGNLPELEDDIESTQSSVETLTEQTGQLRQSLATLQDRVDGTEERMATTDELASVSDELERVGGELEQVRTRLRDADWVEPAQLDAQARDLDALRETVLDHARRLEGVEQTTSDLDNRIEQTFRNTAKAEALSSLQAEVSRLRSNLSGETDAGADTDALDDLDERVRALDERTRALDDRLSGAAEEFDQLRSTVDSVAERAVTRSDLDEQTGALDARTTEALDDLDARLAALENGRGQGDQTAVGSGFARLVLSVALVSAAGLGAMLALASDRPDVAAGFLLLVAGPAVLLWVTELDL